MLGIGFFSILMVYIFVSKTPIRASLVPMLLMVMVLSIQNGVVRPGTHLDTDYIVSHLVFLMIMLGSMVIAGAYGLMHRKLKCNLTFGFLGIAAMGISLIIGGLGSAEFSNINPLLGLGFTVLFLSFFFYFGCIAGEIPFDYLAKLVILASLIPVIQVINVYYVYDLLGRGIHMSGAQLKNYVVVGWSISNGIAPIIALGLPFSAYFMATHKQPWWAFMVFMAQVFGVFLCLSRAMFIFVIPFVPLALIYAHIRSSGNSRIQLTVITAITLAVLSLFVLHNIEVITEVFSFYFNNNYGGLIGDDRGRWELFRIARDAFLRNPLFGAGITYRMDYHDMLFFAHNTILQFMAWGGIVGLFAITVHVGVTIFASVRKSTEHRLILLAAAGMIFLQSLLDHEFFMPPTFIFYLLFIACLERNALNHNGFARVFKPTKGSAVLA